MAAQIKISTFTFVVGKKIDFKMNVDAKTVKIPLDQAVFVNFQNQFKKNTKTQRLRRKTLENFVRSAYLHGLRSK